MDRKIIYPGQIPMVEDQLQAARFTQIGVGRLAGALYDESGTGASGFACAPGSGLSVTISPGQIIQPGVVDTTAFGVLPASASALPRQYVLTDPASITVPGAGATYIIYGTVGTADTANAVLPYYNSANPSQTFAGAGNGGQNQPTVRTDNVTIGIATSVPSGSIPLWAVTVPNGATSITSAMISAASGAPLYPSLRGLAARAVAPFNAALAAAFGGYPSKTIVADPTTTGLFWVSTADNNLTTPGASGASWVTLSSTVGGRWIGTKRFTVSGTYTPTPGTLFAHVRMVGGGASGYGCKGQSSNSTVSVGAGGNAGTYADVIILNPAACSVVIAGSTANGYNGTSIAGGTSSFGSYVSCPGGGAASGADQVTPIWPTGNHSYARPSIASGVIANCLIGDVVGGQGIALALTAGFGGQGANSPFGAGGGQSSPNATGDDAQGYGSGGSGTMSGQNGVALQSGRGAPGYAIVAEWGAI